MQLSLITLIFLFCSAAAVPLHAGPELKTPTIDVQLNSLEARSTPSQTRNFQLAIVESRTGRRNPDSSCTWEPVHWNIHRYEKLPDPNVRTLCGIDDPNNKLHYNGKIFVGSISSKSLFTCDGNNAKAGRYNGYSGTSNICLAAAPGLQASLRMWETGKPVWNTKCRGLPNRPVIYECESGNVCQQIFLLYTCDTTEFEDKSIYVVPDE